MKKIGKKLLILAAVLTITAGMASTAHAATNNFGPGFSGWHQQESGWKFMKNGFDVSNAWEMIDGKWYYFGDQGVMLTGWQSIDGSEYYFSETAEDGAHPLGSCYISEETPDGSKVDENGRKNLNPTTASRPNPYGYSCVEVDVPNQMVYCYIGEELVLYTPCVTGNNARHATPAGSYKMDMHTRDRILRGTNDNGTKYASHVDYWMRFTTNGIGLHDASWRSEFGGDIYLRGGSHGCVNLPHDAAAALFNLTYIGFPVIVHY